MNNNQQEKCTDESCTTCDLIKDLTLEFGELITGDVPWQNALEFVLRTALATDDDAMEELIKEVYGDGFSDGVLYGINKSKSVLDEFHDDVANIIESDDECDCDEYICEDKEDDNDKVQNIIKQNR